MLHCSTANASFITGKLAPHLLNACYDHDVMAGNFEILFYRCDSDEVLWPTKEWW